MNRHATSVYAAFLASAATHADSDFLRAPPSNAPGSGSKGVEVTYRAAAERVAALQSAYCSGNVSAKRRVAIAFDSRLEVYLHLLALNGLGLSIVPLNMGGSDAEIRHVVEHSESEAVVCADEHAARLEAIASDVPVFSESAFEAIEGATGTQANPGGPDREAALLYTSGTTGKPKGCMLSNEYFLFMGRWYNSLEGRCALRGSDRLLTPLPPNHMNALCTSFMGMLLAGGCVIQLDRFHPRSWWATVRDERATIIHYLGVMPAILLTFPAGDQDEIGGQVRFGFGAGSDPRHQEVFESRFGFPLIEAWAMTESGAGGLTIADRDPRHVGQRCIGSPAPHTEFRLVDEQDHDVPAGDPGELLVRCAGDDPRHGFFSGYYRDEAATESGWRGGWWHTGDVVRQGADGKLFFVDRRKNVIRRSGENIAAVEVEAALLRVEGVDNCAAAPVPDEIRGDEVFAFVVLPAGREGGADEARRIFDASREWLAYFKLPGYIGFVDELPLTASQKLERGTIKQNARDAVATGRCHDLRGMKKRS